MNPRKRTKAATNWWRCAPGIDVHRVARLKATSSAQIYLSPWTAALQSSGSTLERRPRDVANVWLRENGERPTVLVTSSWQTDDVAVLGCLLSRVPITLVSSVVPLPTHQTLERRVASLLANQESETTVVDWRHSHLAAARESFPLAALYERWLDLVWKPDAPLLDWLLEENTWCRALETLGAEGEHAATRLLAVLEELDVQSVETETVAASVGCSVESLTEVLGKDSWLTETTLRPTSSADRSWRTMREERQLDRGELGFALVEILSSGFPNESEEGLGFDVVFGDGSLHHNRWVRMGEAPCHHWDLRWMRHPKWGPEGWLSKTSRPPLNCRLVWVASREDESLTEALGALCRHRAMIREKSYPTDSATQRLLAREKKREPTLRKAALKAAHETFLEGTIYWQGTAWSARKFGASFERAVCQASQEFGARQPPPRGDALSAAPALDPTNPRRTQPLSTIRTEEDLRQWAARVQAVLRPQLSAQRPVVLEWGWYEAPAQPTDNPSPESTQSVTDRQSVAASQSVAVELPHSDKGPRGSDDN